MKLFYNSDGTAKVFTGSTLPADVVRLGGFPYRADGSLCVGYFDAVPPGSIRVGGIAISPDGRVCATGQAPARHVGGKPVTDAGALCLDGVGGVDTDGPGFVANLTTSLVLQAGTGSPTFTRATTAYVQNNDGYLVQALSGEARFTGARRIYNLIPAAGSGSASLAVAADKTMTLAAGTYVFSMGAGTGTATFSGTGGATGTLDANVLGRVSVSKTITAGTFIVTASVATLVDLQVEWVDPQTTKTAGEYVSVGVLAAPYHGAGVDGVRYFTVDINGNPIPSI